MTGDHLILLIVNAGVLVGMVFLFMRLRPGNGGKPLQAEWQALRDAMETGQREGRQELAQSLRQSQETLAQTLGQMGSAQHQRLEAVQQQLQAFRQEQQASVDRLRESVAERLREIQQNNDRKLDQMRQTVDERLQGTLEKRLGESFKLVSDRLDAVHRGLGEMQNLAQGVGDLKRVLTNVKTRGTWAEVQLGSILEQILTPGQFERNVRVTPGASEQVEFAVRLPGPQNDPHSTVWLPIDAKFPREDYDRLQDAAEQGDPPAVISAANALLNAIRKAAQDIRSKYIAPPHTTDFAVLYLPTEGLYAEVLRRPGFADELLTRHRVVPAGPTTIAALLSSLRMGFRTLAIEQRVSEVRLVLAAVKTEFGKFSESLQKIRTHLERAQNSVDDTSRRTQAIERRLKNVEQLPGDQSERLLDIPPENSPPEP